MKTRLATAALLGRGFGGHPASRSKRMQILRSAVREAGWLPEVVFDVTISPDVADRAIRQFNKEKNKNMLTLATMIDA